MLERKLYVVPRVYDADVADVFTGTGVFVLDDWLWQGVAGAYFRQLLIESFFDPTRTRAFEAARRCYLTAVVAEVCLPDDAVVIGTAASDVDLMEYGQVCRVRMEADGLEALSRLVHGDPVMMTMRGAQVAAALETSCDADVTVYNWEHLRVYLQRLMREEGRCTESIAVCNDVVVSATRKALGGDELRLRALTAIRGNQEYVNDYNLSVEMSYLACVRVPWRKYVADKYGVAPEIRQILNLPWFVFSPGRVSHLCVRADMGGRYRATARGVSFLDFVRENLMDVLQPRELVGTWLGAMLSDSELAETRIMFNGICVPSAVSGAVVVSAAPEDVQGNFGNEPLRLAGDSAGHSSVMNELFADHDGGGGSAVVGRSLWQLAWRFARTGSDEHVAGRMLQVRKEAICNGEHGYVGREFDLSLLTAIPGYSYLQYVASPYRVALMLQLGPYPTRARLKMHPHFPHIGKRLDVCLSTFPVVRSGFVLEPGTDPAHGGAGYCYDCVFREDVRTEVRYMLGRYPKMRAVIAAMDAFPLDALGLKRVRVSMEWHFTYSGSCRRMWHMQVDRGTVGYVSFIRDLSHEQLEQCVGAIGTCYGSQWFVMAIIAWTIVGVFLAIGVYWLIYQRCAKRGGRY